jgi:hypothetical protein
MKDHLIFDVTDANSIADSDSVGAYLRASDGTLLTHSDVGGKKALDVSVADGINVEVDLSHVDDSVRLGDGTSFFTSTSENGDIALDVHISNSNIEVTQGTSPWVIGDGGGSITVDAVDLDIRDLQFATDQVQIGNASGVADFGSGATTAQTLRVSLATDTSLNVNDAALADTAILSAADTLAVAGTAETVVASALANRKYLFVYNNDNRKMYIGGSGVTAANGFPVSPGSYLEMRAGASSAVYYNSDKASHAIRTLELS